MDLPRNPYPSIVHDKDLVTILNTSFFDDVRFQTYLEQEIHQTQILLLDDLASIGLSEEPDIHVSTPEIFQKLVKEAVMTTDHILQMQPLPKMPTFRLYHAYSFDVMKTAASTLIAGSLFDVMLGSYVPHTLIDPACNKIYLACGIINTLNFFLICVNRFEDLHKWTDKDINGFFDQPHKKCFIRKGQTMPNTFFTIAHEYAHARNYSAFPSRFYPHILSEGIATYAEIEAGRAHARTTNNNRLHRDAESQRLFALSAVEHACSFTPDQRTRLFLDHKNKHELGYALVDFLAQPAYGGIKNIHSLLHGNYDPIYCFIDQAKKTSPDQPDFNAASIN